MSVIVTLELDDSLDEQLSRLAEERQWTKAELILGLLRRQLALAELHETQQLLRPYAEQAGYLTDEDFFRDFS